MYKLFFQNKNHDIMIKNVKNKRIEGLYEA